MVFEFKNWFDDNTTESEAFNQIQHYKQDIPLLFEYNALTVVSLNAKRDIIKEAGPMQNVVHAVCKAVKDNLQIDWTKKEDAKAAIRLAIKKELRGKVSLEELNKILQEIMEQAEGQFKDWPVAG